VLLTAAASVSLIAARPEGDASLGRAAAGAHAYAQVLSAVTLISPVLMGLLGAFAFGHEYRYGTIRPALTVLPTRRALAVAKIVIIFLWAAAASTVCVGTSALLVRIQAPTWLGSTVGLSSPRMSGVALGAILYVAFSALLGLGLGWLLRSLPPAITLLIALPVMIEPLIKLALSAEALHANAISRYLPFSAGAQMYSYSPAASTAAPNSMPSGVGALAGGTIFGLSVAAVLVIGLLVFDRRDA
jgi:ABC-2 type transport system permease protein